MLDQICDVIRQTQKYPTLTDLRVLKHSNPQLPSHSTINSRFGGKRGFDQAVREHVSSNVNWHDLLDLLPKQTAREPLIPQTQLAAPEEGYVYLIEWGSHYKVGRSDNIEQRAKSLQVQLPTKGKLIHTIRTDDPSGIEAYWHRRFADKRANGEWFNLTRADVAAFRRRTFQ